MHPRAALGEELADRRVGAERREQLDVVLADVEQDRLDALGLDDLAVHERHLVVALVERERRVDVLDGDADVVDAGEHAPIVSGRGAAGACSRSGAAAGSR